MGNQSDKIELTIIDGGIYRKGLLNEIIPMTFEQLEICEKALNEKICERPIFQVK